ncbi:hypothetical protein MMC08_005571 [Hypocenomyce scalaris]|nr:hypothetical protein [Hypocenomyce scalaris]
MGPSLLQMLSWLSLSLTIMLELHPSVTSSTELNLAKRNVGRRALMPEASSTLYIRGATSSTQQSGSACPSIADDADQGEDGAPPNTSTFPSPTTGPNSTTPASITPAPSCTLQEEDPDEFINSPYCICGQLTFPVLSVASTGQQSDSCAYTTLPASSTIKPSITLPVATNNCQVCTLQPNEEADCTSLPNCTPTSAPTPSTTVAVSNNPVHIGNAASNGFYDAVLKALQPQCPDPSFSGTVTECESSGAQIKNILYLEPGSNSPDDATITLTIEDSSYTTTGQRNAMLGAAANALNSSATGQSCQTVTYKTSGAECPSDPLDVSGGGCEASMSVCDAANLITVWLFDQGKLQASMNVEVAFEIEGLSNPFDCELILDAVVVALDVIAPEVAAADWAELGEIQAICGEMTG